MPAPPLPKYPFCRAVLGGCRVAAPIGHLSIPQPRDQTGCASLPAAPHLFRGLRGILRFLHPTDTCSPSAPRLLPTPEPAVPITGPGRHHPIAGPEVGGGQRAGSGEGQIRFASPIKPGKDYGLFKPVSAAAPAPRALTQSCAVLEL